MHFHQHLIPRRAGDVSNPRGGVEASYLINKSTDVVDL